MLHALQVSKAMSAHDSVAKQLAETEQVLKDRTDQLAQTSANLEAREAELSKLSQQQQALMLQHERNLGELSDLTSVLKQRQKDNEVLQQRSASCHLTFPPAYQWFLQELQSAQGKLQDMAALLLKAKALPCVAALPLWAQPLLLQLLLRAAAQCFCRVGSWSQHALQDPTGIDCS